MTVTGAVIGKFHTKKHLIKLPQQATYVGEINVMQLLLQNTAVYRSV